MAAEHEIPMVFSAKAHLQLTFSRLQLIKYWTAAGHGIGNYRKIYFCIGVNEMSSIRSG